MFTWLKSQKRYRSLSPIPFPSHPVPLPGVKPLLLVSNVSFQDILCGTNKCVYMFFSSPSFTQVIAYSPHYSAPCFHNSTLIIYLYEIIP